MGIHFLFPSNPVRASEIDAVFADQWEALVGIGFTASVFPESVLRNGKPLRQMPAEKTVVYRGWMLNEAEYGNFVRAVEGTGATVFTPVDAYLAGHHLPNWYPLISEFTPETRVMDVDGDVEGQLRSLGWDSFFIKDYVKSVKTSVGSIIREPSQIRAVLSEMERIRGEIEGGLCVRRVEAFEPETERRYFVLNGQAIAADGNEVPQIVKEVAARIPSQFFSVDVVRRVDGVLRVVEVGDGQVSDLVGWTSEEFARMWITAAKT